MVQKPTRKRNDEAKFMARVRALAKENNWLYYHTADSRRSPAGYPDITLVKDGTIIFTELKTMIGRVTKDQKIWLEALNNCQTVETYLWRPNDMEYITRRLVEGPVPSHI